MVGIVQDYFTNQTNDREQQATKALLVEQVRLATVVAINQSKTSQALEDRVKELEGQLAAQAIRKAPATRKP